MLEILQTINGYLADYILSFLLLGTGIYFTVKTRFVQVRCFGEGMKKVFGNFSMSGGKQSGGISSWLTNWRIESSRICRVSGSRIM